MEIDISKVKLYERDIEDWLYANPHKIVIGPHSDNPIVRWIGRQYALPSGIADLIGVRASGLISVIEVKNVPMNKAAVLQVLRYARDVEDIVRDQHYYRESNNLPYPCVERVLIGPAIDIETWFEARACHVNVLEFSPTVTLQFGHRALTPESAVLWGEQISGIAQRAEWTSLGEQFYAEPAPWEKAKPAVNSDEYDQLLDAIVNDDGPDIEEIEHGEG